MFKKIPFVAFVGMVYLGLIGVMVHFQIIWLEPVLTWGTMAFLWAGGIYAWYHLYRCHGRIFAWGVQVIVLALVILRAAAIHTEGATIVDRVIGTMVLWVANGPYLAGFFALLLICAFHLFAHPAEKPSTMMTSTALPAE